MNKHQLHLVGAVFIISAAALVLATAMFAQGLPALVYSAAALQLFVMGIAALVASEAEQNNRTAGTARRKRARR